MHHTSQSALVESPALEIKINFSMVFFWKIDFIGFFSGVIYTKSSGIFSNDVSSEHRFYGFFSGVIYTKSSGFFSDDFYDKKSILR